MHTRSAATSELTRTWTVLSLIQWATEYLVRHNFDEARLHVELLLAHVLSLKRIELYTNFDRPVDRAELAEFKTIFQRRLAREPLQYILGETEFMGLPLFVNEGVLIPRPETEILVEKTLDTIKTFGTQTVEVLDIGTGSGNIAVAIASFASNANVNSIDVSAQALETAARNVHRHGVRSVTLHHADVFAEFLPGRKFDIIVSNPPYVSAKEFALLDPEVRQFEPAVATTDRGDGYRFLKRISEIASHRLHIGGYLLMEIAYDQSIEALHILREAGFSLVEVFNDFGGIPRVVRARTAG
jgi:release factor glutamine methyltransferase